MSDFARRGTGAVEFVADIHGLPEPPGILAQLLDTPGDRCAKSGDVAKIIERDPEISAAVLRLADSRPYAHGAPACSLEQAVLAMGVDAARSFAVSASIVPLFAVEAIPQTFRDALWSHSVTVAFGCRILMRHIHPSQMALGETAFACGLLHDSGKLALWLRDPGVYRSIAFGPAADPGERLAAERDAFGLDHGQVGSEIGRVWRLPQEMLLAIGHHHEPLAIEDRIGLVACVHVADALSYHLPSDQGAGLAAPAIEPGVFEGTGLRLEEMATYMHDLQTELVATRSLLGLIRGE